MKSICMRLCLIAAAAVLCAHPATAQQQNPLGYKDPGTATLISVLVPGGGQMYSGETRKGATLLGIGLGGLVLGTALSVESVGCDGLDCDTDANMLPMAAGYLVYLGSWVYGIMDASDSANRMNAKRGMALGGVQVEPEVAVQREGGTRVGVTLRF